MSRIVFAHDLRKSVILKGAKPPFYARPRVWIGLGLLNVALLSAVAMSWKMDSLWGILPAAKAYPVTSMMEHGRPTQSASGQITGSAKAPDALSGDHVGVAIVEASGAPVAAKIEPLSLPAQKAALYIAKTYNIAGEAAEIIVRETYKASRENSIDPMLMLAVIAVESRFNPLSASPAGAVGLTQTMPESHPEKIALLQKDQGHILNIADNIQLGTKIVGEYMRKFDGNAVMALQQYNGSLQDKTRVYSKKVLELRAKILQAAG